MDKCVDLIRLSGVPLETILELLQQMKMLATAAPQQAKLMLAQDPKLANAMFQAMLTMGLVKPEALMQQILAIQAAAAGHPPAPAPAALQPAPRPAVPVPLPPAAAVPPPPATATAAAPIMQDPSMADEQKAMLLRVLALTPEQIAALPPSEQQAILLIRQSLGAA